MLGGWHDLGSDRWVHVVDCALDMVKRKVSLGGPVSSKKRQAPATAPTVAPAVVELFFNTGIIFHEVALPDELPDLVSSFVIVQGDGGRDGYSVRKAEVDEEPDVELSAIEHLPELSGRWLPFPYQLSCLHCVQIFLQAGDQPRLLMAIDTAEHSGAKGRHLDAAQDGGRPYPALSASAAGFLDHPDTRELMRRLEREGIERAPFKYAALIEMLAPLMPRLKLAAIDEHTPVEVSLVLDLGNSRSTAVLVESRESQMFSVPLEVRNSSNPFEIASGTIGSRITFLPSPFDKAVHNVAVASSFGEPSVARMGREALDRALETPHRYACSLSGPKRYLWDGQLTDERWYFATKQRGEYAPIAGRLLKYVVEDGGGLELRQDGPTTPADPRYAPRTLMLFAIVELLSQALSQINSLPYRTFQGKEASPRVLKHFVLTYPSAMPDAERQVYDSLVRNAVALTCFLYNIKDAHRPNCKPDGSYETFLLADEALAAQMVYVYEEVVHAYSGNMADLVRVYGHEDGSLRVASVDIGGGTTDVMIAEYRDKLPGTGTALAIRKLFQDGVSVAGDDVCRAICEDIVFDQILQQLPSASARSQLSQLFAEGDGGHGATWRTLKAKLVPYFWMPLARCYWALGEGFSIPEHSAERHYSVQEIFRIFEVDQWSAAVFQEADAFISSQVRGFPGMNNFFFRFEPSEIEAAIDRVLREPLRRYSDILAQFDIDLLILAGRTSALKRVYELFVSELPVPPPRIKRMSDYHVSDWYPAKWRKNGLIEDPKSTVTAGATILHLAGRNRLPGLLLEQVEELEQKPILGLYQLSEPHIAHQNELFRDGNTSPEFAYTGGMMIGFRNVDSEQMDGSPLYEVRPASDSVRDALLEDRVSLQFRRTEEGITVAKVVSQRGQYSFEPTDFVLELRTAVQQRYWLDTGVLRSNLRHGDEEEERG